MNSFIASFVYWFQMTTRFSYCIPADCVKNTNWFSVICVLYWNILKICTPHKPIRLAIFLYLNNDLFKNNDDLAFPVTKNCISLPVKFLKLEGKEKINHIKTRSANYSTTTAKNFTLWTITNPKSMLHTFDRYAPRMFKVNNKGTRMTSLGVYIWRNSSLNYFEIWSGMP